MKNSDGTNIEKSAEMKTMLAAMAAEMAEWKRAAGGSITWIVVTLAGNADAGAVNVWCAGVRPESDQVRPSQTKKI